MTQYTVKLQGLNQSLIIDATKVLRALLFFFLFCRSLIAVTVTTTSLEVTYKKWDTTETLWRDAIDHNPNDRHALHLLANIFHLDAKVSDARSLHLMERSVEGKLN